MLRTAWNPSVLIVAGLIFGCLIGAAWPEPAAVVDGGPRSPFWHFVWQWQTMTTGVLALCAAIYAAHRAWVSVNNQIRSDKENMQAQLAEMRAQFRHQMLVTTEVARAAADRQASKPLRQLHGIERSADKIVRVRGKGRGNLAVSTFNHALLGCGRGFVKWFEQEPNDSIKDRFTAKDAQTVEMFCTTLSNLREVSVEDDIFDDEELVLLAEEASEIAARVSTILEGIKGAVPD